VQDFILWMHNTWLGQFMANWQWAWAWAEVTHFIGMSMLFGAVLVMDLRLLGFFRNSISIRAVRQLAPWAAAGFSLNLLSGIAFVAKDADRIFPNHAFDFKMICVLVALLNVLLYEVKFGKQVATWRDDVNPPVSAKLMGLVSLVAWTLVIWGGRLMPVFGAG